jgi:hypothetical protein
MQRLSRSPHRVWVTMGMQPEWGKGDRYCSFLQPRQHDDGPIQYRERLVGLLQYDDYVAA